MKFQRALIVALGAALSLGACASAGGGEAGPGGVRPAETRHSTSAKLFLAQAEGATGEQGERLYRQALEQALQGVESAPNNPQHYYLAGISYAGIGDTAGADSMFTRATEMYPAYAGDVEGAREAAWVRFFNEAVAAFNEQDTQRALQLWGQANQIYNMRPEGYLNIAVVETQEGRNDRAIAAYRGAIEALGRQPTRELTAEEVEERTESRQAAMTNLGQLLLATEQFGEAERLYRDYLQQHPDDIAAQSSLAVVLSRQGRGDEAMQTYQRLLASPDLDEAGLMVVGVGLFQAEQYPQAAEAFQRITTMNPNNRDAWYNLANALYAQNLWADVIPAGERLVALDPLNENANLILARAYREQRRNQDALRILERNEAAPVLLDNLQLRAAEGRTALRGTAQPKAARAGTPVQLRFTFFDGGRELGQQTVTVTAPAQGATADFEAVLQNATPANGYRYEVVR